MVTQGHLGPLGAEVGHYPHLVALIAHQNLFQPPWESGHPTSFQGCRSSCVDAPILAIPTP